MALHCIALRLSSTHRRQSKSRTKLQNVFHNKSIKLETWGPIHIDMDSFHDFYTPLLLSILIIWSAFVCNDAINNSHRPVEAG